MITMLLFHLLQEYDIAQVVYISNIHIHALFKDLSLAQYCSHTYFVVIVTAGS